MYRYDREPMTALRRRFIDDVAGDHLRTTVDHEWDWGLPDAAHCH